MKNICILLLISASLAISFSFPASAQIPSSRRSRDAIKRVAPALSDRLQRKNMRLGAPVYIRIFKKSKEVEVWVEKDQGFELFETYEICTFGFGGLGPKVRQGDGMAPEGFYFVPPGALNPFSDFHLSFNLGYPNAYDRAHNRTGSALMVHGSCVSRGCYAMTDPRIEEIYCLADAAFRGGQPYFRVHIFPFRMNEDNMKKHHKSNWIDFWRNLKQGYDLFEINGCRPPNVEVRRGRYLFD